jgi:DNA helicase HerA-like ATPase
MRSSVCQSNSVSQILKSLGAGKHVVIEFGTQSHPMSYMLATNVIVRRIHGLYVQKTEKFLGTKNPMDRPRQLVITIEDAHRFLSTPTVRQTIFNTIADKGRKNSISLLIVDQRPSKIDIDFMSQLGSFITAFLDNQKDIDAICAGVSGNQNLRSLLAKLDVQQQALFFGHALPKPIVVNTRSYDLTFYQQMGDTSWEEMSDEEIFAAAEAAKADLGF